MIILFGAWRMQILFRVTKSAMRDRGKAGSSKFRSYLATCKGSGKVPKVM